MTTIPPKRLYRSLGLLSFLVFFSACDQLREWAVSGASGVDGEGLIRSEGSPTAPVALSVGSRHEASLGSLDSVQNASYYLVTASTGAYYRLEVQTPSRPFAVSHDSSLAPLNDPIWSGEVSVAGEATLVTDRLYLSPGIPLHVGLFNHAMNPVRFGLLFSPIPNPNEGTISEPISLKSNLAHQGFATPNSAPYLHSTYRFSSPTNDNYDLVATRIEGDVLVALSGGDPLLQAITLNADTGSGAMLIPGLSYGSRVTITATCNGTAPAKYRLLMRPHWAFNEGSSPSPILLTAGSARASSCGIASESTSYYRFTTGSTGFRVSASSLMAIADLDFMVYGDSDYTVLKGQSSGPGSSELVMAAEPAGTYWLKVVNNAPKPSLHQLKVDAP